MKANSDKSKQSNKATRRVLAGVLCGASVLSLVLSLVMPPISQAIANDAQTVSTEETVMGGGSSSESTGVENANNGDTEKQDSDDAKGGETDPTNGVGQNQAEDQPEGDLQVEDNEPADDNAVKAAAEGGQAETASGETDSIDSADKLKTKLENAKGTANFELANDIDTSTTIQLDEDGSNITLDLKGHKIKHTSPDQPLFNITGGATLTIKDTDPKKPSESVDNGKQLNDQGQTLDRVNYGKEAELSYNNGIPSNLTYYVTQSSPSAIDTTKTTETLFKHSVEIKGAIVACGGNEHLRLINLYATDRKGGAFKLESGVITQQENTQQKKCWVDSLVYAESGSTVNMSGGYVCGATSRSQGAGIELKGEGTTLNLTGGVIAGNYAPNGGGVHSDGSSVSISENAVISGNATFNGESDQPGYGGGIKAVGGSVAVSGGYITNNRMSKFCGTDGSGNHGGGGLAANYGVKVTISGGQITGNYSEEAGGGVYVTDQWRDGSREDMTWLNITGGIIASNVSYRSEGAGIRVGQKVDVMIGPKESNDTKSKVYITNNTCLSRFDWGGGGIFVQGDSNTASNAGRLFVYNSYISSNEAGGYGGGVAVCPTGKTLVTNTDGTAIFGNTSAGSEQSANDYDSASNKGNDGTPHLSGGGHGKDQDSDAYNTKVFRENGHADFFLAAEGHNEPIAAVIGKMLGGGDAQYKGSKELKDAITIPANGGVQVYNSIGLSSGVKAGDPAATTAQSMATTFITGNYSWNHGGGIMSNGDLYLGVPADMYVYPSLKLKATKALIKLINPQTKEKMALAENQFAFKVYRKNSSDPLTSTTFNRDVCTEVGTAKNDANGNITFDLGEQFATGGAGDRITYYLVEDPGNDSGITYDSSVYEIAVSAKDTKTVLMTVPKKDNPNEQIELNIHNYAIDKVNVTKYEFDNKSEQWKSVNAWSNVRKSDDYYPIACEDSSTTFTNEYTPYNSYGSWTPKATKVVEGGEMKEFTLEFANNEEFKNAQEVKTQANGVNPQPLNLVEKISYTIDDLTKGADSTGRSASKTFFYYVREKDEHSTYPHYKFDQSVYRFKVVATDNTKGGIDCTVTYRKGIVSSDGKWVDDDTADHEFTDASTPTFTNTYSTSLPLSGMSGVTLTYLAGAAVLCAAAAWMYIRRKANAKGGERRE